MTPDSESHPRVDDWLDENDVEYEVEPPDEAAANVKRRQIEEAAAEVVQRAAQEDDYYQAQPWEDKFVWRFSLRDLFAITSIVAVALAAFQFGGICPAGAIGGLLTFFWLLIYLERQDPTVRRTNPLAPQTPDPHRRPPLRITYSTADLLIAMTIAAGCFSLLRIFPPPLAAASLGFFVLAGIVMYWLGASPPRRALLAWFILTAMYLVVSAIAVVTS